MEAFNRKICLFKIEDRTLFLLSIEKLIALEILNDRENLIIEIKLFRQFILNRNVITVGNNCNGKRPRLHKEAIILINNRSK